MKFIVNEAEIGIVVCSQETLREMVKILPECPSIQVVILMDLALNCTKVFLFHPNKECVMCWYCASFYGRSWICVVTSVYRLPLA